MRTKTISRCCLYAVLLTWTHFGWSTDPATLIFNLDQCTAFFTDNSLADYSEFTADVQNTDQISLSVVDGNLFRNMPFDNPHSCTPSFNGSEAMCVGYDRSCDFNPGNETAVRFGVMVTPTGNQPVTLTNLRFYDLAPTSFDWIDGANGPNNPPTLMAVRVLVLSLIHISEPTRPY